MNILLEIYNKIILNETVSVNSVTDSIKNRYRVTINYEGDPSHGIAPGIRTIEVYAYGLTKAGNPVIRAYQPYGDTVTTVPSWKFFRIDRIKKWSPTYSLVTKPAPGFNPNGDKSMSTVYSIANFSEVPNISNMTGPKQSPRIVGKLDNIEKILADREKERQRNKEQHKILSNKPVYKNKIQEPEIKAVDKITNQEPETNKSKIQEPPIEPEVKGVDNKQNVFKPEGEMSELEKIKDLNRRIDNARKIDLNSIPKR